MEDKQKQLDIVYLRMTLEWANMSKAKKAKVGCLIVKNKTIISDGYNGMPSGMTNECELKIPPTNMGNRTNRAGLTFRYKTKPEVLHAEANAITKLAKSTNSSNDATLYCNYAPCLDCAKLIIQAGISKVVYLNPYRDSMGISLLEECNVKIIKYESDDLKLSTQLK